MFNLGTVNAERHRYVNRIRPGDPHAVGWGWGEW